MEKNSAIPVEKPAEFEDELTALLKERGSTAALTGCGG